MDVGDADSAKCRRQLRPRLLGDFGFHDVRVGEVRDAQADVSRRPELPDSVVRDRAVSYRRSR
jgi:hypothetical protein